MIIDFHNHFYPAEYLAALKAGPSDIKMTYDDEGNPLLHYPGDYNILVPGHRDIEYRATVLEKVGVDKQILTFTTPGVHIEKPKRAVELAKIVNDGFAHIMKDHSDHFTALATLPMNDVEASVVELRRTFEELGFRGVTLFSNINGESIGDAKFGPVLEAANELGVVIDIHPHFPVGVEAMTEYWLMPLLGFTFDTTLTAAKLVFSGATEKYPNIKWVLGHLGGTIPYLAERLDRGYEAFKECRENISKPPSEYLKEFYFDSVNFDVNCLELALKFAGADHIVAGSDYPHQIGSLKKMVESIGKLDISENDKAAIYGGNARKLLGL